MQGVKIGADYALLTCHAVADGVEWSFRMFHSGATGRITHLSQHCDKEDIAGAIAAQLGLEVATEADDASPDITHSPLPAVAQHTPTQAAPACDSACITAVVTEAEPVVAPVFEAAAVATVVPADAEAVEAAAPAPPDAPVESTVSTPVFVELPTPTESILSEFVVVEEVPTQEPAPCAAGTADAADVSTNATSDAVEVMGTVNAVVDAVESAALEAAAPAVETAVAVEAAAAAAAAPETETAVASAPVELCTSVVADPMHTPKYSEAELDILKRQTEAAVRAAVEAEAKATFDVKLDEERAKLAAMWRADLEVRCLPAHPLTPCCCCC